MTHASAIGSTFDGRIVAETRVGGRAGDRAGDPRQRLDHRHHAAVRRSRRPLPGGLPARRHLGRQRARQPGLTAGRGRPRPAAPPQDNGTVVSENAACSGTSKRATPAAFVVTGAGDRVRAVAGRVPEHQVERRARRQAADAVRRTAVRSTRRSVPGRSCRGRGSSARRSGRCRRRAPAPACPCSSGPRSRTSPRPSRSRPTGRPG